MTILTLKQKVVQEALVSLDDFFVLLSFVTKKPKSFLFAHDEYVLTEDEQLHIESLLQRRVLHEPVAYLIHSREFYGRTFFVDERVLIPRPETELLIDTVLSDVSSYDEPCCLIDVGTGSGAIILTLAKTLPSLHRFIGVDISPDALTVARQNQKLLEEAEALFFESDLIKNIPSEYFSLTPIIIANLPYVPQKQYDEAMPDVKNYEPAIALVSGTDGLNHYRELIKELKQKNLSSFILYLEIDSSQTLLLEELLKEHFPKGLFTVYKDLASHDRIIKYQVKN